MASYTAKHLDDMEAGFGGGFVKARAELGVSSFGLQVIRLPPESTHHPEHDHLADGQEEVYLALEGSGWLEIEGERVELAKGVFVKVEPAPRRRAYAGPEGLSMLVLGGCPGEAYKINPMTELQATQPGGA